MCIFPLDRLDMRPELEPACLPNVATLPKCLFARLSDIGNGAGPLDATVTQMLSEWRRAGFQFPLLQKNAFGDKTVCNCGGKVLLFMLAVVILDGQPFQENSSKLQN